MLGVVVDIAGFTIRRAAGADNYGDLWDAAARRRPGDGGGGIVRTRMEKRTGPLSWLMKRLHAPGYASRLAGLGRRVTPPLREGGPGVGGGGGVWGLGG